MIEQAEDRNDAGDRGTLRVDDRVITRIASTVATSVAGVVPRESMLTKVTGRGFPRISAHVDGGHIRIDADLAVTWPASVVAVAEQVRADIASKVGEYTGMTVDRVDVTIKSLVPASSDGPDELTGRVR